jgi:HlyD family secretion protein
MTKHKRVYGASAAAVALVAWASFGYARGETDDAKPITRAVLRGDIVQSVSATGALEAVTTVEVGSQVSGTVDSLHADFNSLVRKGEIIATLEPSLFDTQVQQARANLLKAQSDLERLQVAAADAASKLGRARELSEKLLIPSADLDAADVAKRSADAQVRSAEAGVAQSRAALGQTEVTLSKTVIAAPIDGIVIARNVDVGQTVAASVQAPTLFIIAADLSKMRLSASIDESDVGAIRTGQPVTFRVGAYPNESFSGTVEQLRLNPVVEQNVVTYAAIIAVPNPELKLKPGMTATITIEIDKRSNVLRVPNAALQYRPAGETKGTGTEAWVESNGVPARVSLKTGLSDGTYTELLSGPIAEGALVITGKQSAGQQQPRTGSTSGNPFGGTQQGPPGFSGGPR